jgi:hypothetical protein
MPATPAYQPAAAQPQFQPQPQWQGAPPTAYLASGVQPQLPPAKARGVAPETPAIRKFDMPSPEALGITVTASAPQPASTQVDWKQIQSRMERLGVLRYKKIALANGAVGVSMLLPTSDPAMGQPVEAQAQTEAAAILLALDAAEAWARKR